MLLTNSVNGWTLHIISSNDVKSQVSLQYSKYIQKQKRIEQSVCSLVTRVEAAVCTERAKGYNIPRGENLSPRKRPYFDLVVGLVGSNDPGSQAGCSIDTGKVTPAGQDESDDPDIKVGVSSERPISR